MSEKTLVDEALFETLLVSVCRELGFVDGLAALTATQKQDLQQIKQEILQSNCEASGVRKALYLYFKSLHAVVD